MKDYIDKKGLKTIGEYINEQDQLLSQQIATKQDTLVSGTNIKTLNNSSVLGEGNIDVQEPLVSGTNIKTINNSPILGAGNVEVQEQLVSGTNIKTVNNESILGAGNIDVSVNAATTLDIQRLFRTEYSITTTVTNGSFSGDTSIWTEETAEVTIIPNTGYLLPSSIEVSGATYTYDDTTGVVYLSAVISNVTIAATCSLPQLATPNISLDTDNLVIEDVDDAESYDVYVDDVYATNVGNQNPRLFKGDIISFDALGDGTQKRFRVLKVNGAEVELLALDDYRTSAFNSSRIAVVFDSGVQGLKYADSLVDVAVNTNYYNALSATVKAAIIPQSRIQSMYEYGSGQSSSADFNIKLIKTSDD